MSGFAPPARLAAAACSLGSVGSAWLASLPDLVSELEVDWGVTCGRSLDGGNTAYVLEAVTTSGRPLVLKLSIPPGISGFSDFEDELKVLRAANGDPYPELIRFDRERRCLLIERLGRALSQFGWTTQRQIAAIADTLARGWKRVAVDSLTSGHDKAIWLADYIAETWGDLGRPCSEQAAELAITYARERAECCTPETAVLVHGDGHPDNVLEDPRSGAKVSFRLIDPEGLASEPAHDLGVTLRGWNDELLARDPVATPIHRNEYVSKRSGVEPWAIWQWSYVERVSTGLFLLELGNELEARRFLEVAEHLVGVLPATIQ